MDFMLSYVLIPEIMHCLDAGLYQDNKDTLAIIANQQKEAEFQM